jgi:hypothetical protein
VRWLLWHTTHYSYNSSLGHESLPTAVIALLSLWLGLLGGGGGGGGKGGVQACKQKGTHQLQSAIT